MSHLDDHASLARWRIIAYLDDHGSLARRRTIAHLILMVMGHRQGGEKGREVETRSFFK
jgi:hypothetical protein